MEHVFVMPALVGLLLMVSMMQFALTRTDRSRSRQLELERVKDLLPRHYDALERVQAAEALPPEMKEIATWVSSAIEDEATAHVFVERLLDLQGESGDRGEESVEVKNLRATHPEMMDDYDLAMSTGVLAVLLKWPETAQRSARILDELLTSRRGETAIAFRVAKEHRQMPGRPALAEAV